MSDTSFNEQAAVLVERAVGLIKQVLVKHSAAVLEEMRDQIVARNDRIADLEREMPLYEEIRKESRERREKLEQAEAQLEAANKKGHEAVLLAMKHEDVAKRANAEVFRLAELLRKADPKWGSPMHLNTSTKPPEPVAPGPKPIPRSPHDKEYG